MSRIGKKPVLIPQGVAVSVENDVISVKGSKGELSYTLRPEIGAKVEDDSISFYVKEDTKNTSAYWGLVRALVGNMVKGVTEGFEKKLELVGVGYRAKAITGGVSLSVGFSHSVDYLAPKGIEISVVDTQNITIRGFDKQLVGLVAAQIRKVRKPEPYKGKGIKYAGEVVRRKVGKSGKV